MEEELAKENKSTLFIVWLLAGWITACPSSFLDVQHLNKCFAIRYVRKWTLKALTLIPIEIGNKKIVRRLQIWICFPNLFIMSRHSTCLMPNKIKGREHLKNCVKLNIIFFVTKKHFKLKTYSHCSINSLNWLFCWRK